VFKREVGGGGLINFKLAQGFDGAWQRRSQELVSDTTWAGVCVLPFLICDDIIRLNYLYI
jgi:hypothetical protein